MKRFLSAVFATIIGGCAFGVTFAPKEYVDNLLDATLPLYLRNDKANNEVQIFGGYLSGFGFHADTGYNGNGWNQYTAHNGRQLSQSLPDYISSNPWGFLIDGNYSAVTNAAFRALPRALAGFTPWKPYDTPEDPAGYSFVSATYGNGGWNVVVLFDGDAEPRTFANQGGREDDVILTFSLEHNSLVRSRFASVDEVGEATNALALAVADGTIMSAEAIVANNLGGNGQMRSASTIFSALDAVEPIPGIVNTWEGYWGGTNVIFEVTNYYGNTSGEIPRLRIKELRNDVWHTVWDEIDKFNVCETNIMTNVTKVVNAAVEEANEYAKTNCAPLAWGTVTDKGSPNVVGNSVWMTAPETYFAGGTEYQRVAVGSGTICVLVDNGAGAYTTGEEGTFRFQDAGGTNYFGFAKSDSYTIGCRTDGITVESNLVTLRYDVIMGGSDVPIVYWRLSLGSGEWVQLNNTDGTAADGAPYTVTWYTSGGSYYAAINCGSNASGFFKAETSVAGDAVFETNMKARLGGGIECMNTQSGVTGVIRPTYNGSTVNWTWSAK